MIARGDTGLEADDAKHRPARNGGADLLVRWVFIAVIVGRQRVARPDDTVVGAGPVRENVLDLLVDDDAGAALRIMAGDHAADIDAHRFLLRLLPCFLRRAAS